MYKALGLILALAFAAMAQSPAKILNRAEKALGGTKAIQERSSSSLRGRITRLSDGASGQFKVETTRPNYLHILYDIAGDEVEIGYNGHSGWRRDSKNGLQTLTGSESLALQAQAAFRNSLWLNAKTEKTRIVSGAKASVNSRSADIVIFTTPKGVATKIFFDSQSGLPIKEESGSDSWEYDDYRSVAALKVPYLIRMSADGQTYEINLDNASVNQTMTLSKFDFPRSAGQPLPDVDQLLVQLEANQERIEELLDTYSYTRKVISREVDKKGSLNETQSETQQMSFYKGRRIERTIEKNGKPLSADDQADEDKAVAKRAGEIEKRIAKTEKNGSSDDSTQRTVSIAELLKASRLINPRRERFRGRDVIVFDFEPNPSFDLKNAKSMLKFFGKTAGVIWVDEMDKQMVRVEAYLADDFSIAGGMLIKLKKGATFTAEQERVNDEIWLPSLMEINLSARVLMLKGIALNQLIRSYDYRKFKTEVKDAKVNEVQKP
jgi:hypothetical protein